MHFCLYRFANSGTKFAKTLQPVWQSTSEISEYHNGLQKKTFRPTYVVTEWGATGRGKNTWMLLYQVISHGQTISQQSLGGLFGCNTDSSTSDPSSNPISRLYVSLVRTAS